MCDILIQKLKPTQCHTDFNLSPTADSSWRAEDSAGIRSLLSKFHSDQSSLSAGVLLLKVMETDCVLLT